MEDITLAPEHERGNGFKPYVTLLTHSYCSVCQKMRKIEYFNNGRKTCIKCRDKQKKRYLTKKIDNMVKNQ